MHPDTLGDYFSGRKFPKSDIANRLCELTDIECLRPDVGSNSSSEMVPQESSTTPLLQRPPGVAASIEEPQELDITGPPGPIKEERQLGKSLEMIARQLPRELPKKGWRHGERSVVISLQRTICPFCTHDIARFCSRVYCGQYFVWANVPVEYGEPIRRASASGMPCPQ
ncbi:hypothetical protein ACFLVN_04415 [Chloroflexota bacterium]